MNAKHSAALALALLLAACGTTSGTKVDQSQMAQFHEGATTYDDVIKALGEPSSSSVDSNGNRTISYFYNNMKIKTASFIPFAGMVAGGTTHQNTTATFIFDKNGILTHDSQTQSGQDNKTGL